MPSPSDPRPAGHRRRTAGAAVAVVCGAALVLSGALPAAAQPDLAQAQRQAATLRAQVAALQTQAELAAEEYDAVDEQLGDATTRYLTAAQDLQTVTQTSRTDDAVAGARVRAIYEAGGQAALYASVLDGRDISDVMGRLQAIRSLLGKDGQTARTDDAAVTRAAQASASLAALTATKTALQNRAVQAAAHVRELVMAGQALLAQADSQVRAIVAAQEAAAAQAAAEAVARAQAAALATGEGPGGLDTLGLSVPGNPYAAAAVTAARSVLGAPYVWGGSGPQVFDCSGLTSWSYARAGLHLPRTAAEQWSVGPHVPVSSLAPGDLLFYATDLADPATIHHVTMYIGNGLMIQAPHTGAFVRIDPVDLGDGYIGASRP